MSFLGGIAKHAQLMVAANAHTVHGSALLCCAGNFTMAAALRSGGFHGEIRACDITLYTSALGSHLSGSDLDIQERESCPKHLRGLLRPEDPAHLAASVSLLLGMRQIWTGRHPWQRRQIAEYRRRWDEFIEKGVERVNRYREHCGQMDYRAQDALEFLDEHEPSGTVFIAPPTFGTSDYLNQERMFEAICRWRRPSYSDINFQSIDLYEQIARFDGYYVVMERPFPEVETVLGPPASVVHKGRRSTIYVYARQAERRLVVRTFLQSESAGPVLDPDATIHEDSQIGLTPLNHRQTVRLNELYMAARVDYYLADVALSLGIVVDGKIIGKLDFKRTTHQWSLEPRQMVYLQSDLAVPSRKHPRLSKLVLLAALSREVKAMVEDKLQDEFCYAVTTAFSRHAVSMKYRGVFKLHKRLDNPEGFRLNYYGAMGAHSLTEALSKWRKKYDKQTKKQGS